MRHLPLCIDLDHTLISVDLTREACFFLCKKSLRGVASLACWSARGLYHQGTHDWPVILKTKLAQTLKICPRSLPYHQTILQDLREKKDQGHTLILATGAPHVWAQAVGDFLGLFDDVMGTTNRNFVGPCKAQGLVKRYGDNGFIYYGDSIKDLHVWKHAHEAVMVNPSSRVQHTFQQMNMERCRTIWILPTTTAPQNFFEFL